jgi:peptide chain release factor 1
VHTSTVTVAIVDGQKINIEDINENDISIEWYSGSGAGGQYRNKHQNSCRLTHIPTGITTQSQTRSRQNSYKLAFDELKKRITDLKQTELTGNIASDRKQQVGSGMRGDKIRTYRFQDDSVVDHRTNKRAKTSQVLKGRFDLLW